VVAPLKEQLEKWRRELEDSWNPPGNNISQWVSWPMPILMPMFLALLFLSFLPCIITSCTFRDINLSKTAWRTAMRAPTRTQESEDLAPYSAPCQQEAAKRPQLHPNSLSSAPTPIIIKEKMGE
jgi:hypothetical protein